MTDDESHQSAPESLPNYLADGMPKQDDATLREIREFAEALLEYRQRAVKPDELPDTAEPVDESDGRGTVVKEKVTCGDSGCHCTDSDRELHGACLYRYHYADSKLRNKYIGKPAGNPDIETT